MNKSLRRVAAAWREFWWLDEPLDRPKPAPPPQADLFPQSLLRAPWVALRTGGGGKFTTPELTEDEAIEYVTRRGSHSIVTVDAVNRYIFYADKR